MLKCFGFDEADFILGDREYPKLIDDIKELTNKLVE